MISLPPGLLKNRFIRNLSWQFIANIAQAAFAGILLLFLSKILSPHDFGIYSVVLAIVGVGLQCFEIRGQDISSNQFWFLSAEEKLPRLTKHESQIISELFFLELISRFIPASLMIVMGNFILKLNPQINNYYGLLVIASMSAFFLKCFNGVSFGVLRLLGKTNVIAQTWVFEWGGKLIVALVLWFFGSLDLYSLMFAHFVVAVFVGCNLFLKTYLLLKKIGYEISFGYSDGGFSLNFKKYKKLFFSNWGISISDLMSKDLDLTILAAYSSVQNVGLYRLGKYFVQTVWRLVDPIYLSIMPEVQILWKTKKYLELQSLINKTTFRLFLFSLIGASCLLVSVFFLQNFYLDSSYKGIFNLNLLMIIWILVAAPLIWGHPLMVAIEKSEMAFVFNLISSIVGILLLYLLVPKMTYWGAAISWVVTLVVGFVLNGIYSYSTLKRVMKNED